MQAVRVHEGGRLVYEQVNSVRPLAEAEAALTRMESGEHFGKFVLSIG